MHFSTKNWSFGPSDTAPADFDFFFVKFNYKDRIIIYV